MLYHLFIRVSCQGSFNAALHLRLVSGSLEPSSFTAHFGDGTALAVLKPSIDDLLGKFAAPAASVEAPPPVEVPVVAAVAPPAKGKDAKAVTVKDPKDKERPKSKTAKEAPTPAVHAQVEAEQNTVRPVSSKPQTGFEVCGIMCMNFVS